MASDLIQRVRAGHRPTLTDKIDTLDSVEEADGFREALRDQGRVMSDGEHKAFAERRARLALAEQRRRRA